MTERGSEAATRVYTRAEYLSDAAIHVLGVLAALIAAPVLVTLTAVWTGDAGSVTAVTIYAITLIAMLSCSALYNMIRAEDWQPVLRRVDQSAIYMKIAGTYTPFVFLTGGQMGLFLAAVWSVAGAGAALITFGSERVKPFAIVLYLGLGWAGAVWGGDMIAGLSTPAFVLLLIGGILYSVGVVFLLWRRLPFHNTIWHVFVLAATILLYASLVVELAGHARLA
jgi:hemolysin III